MRGRPFDDRDAAGAPAVVILSEKTAATLWPGEDPIGRTVKFARADGIAEWRTVVGVVGNRFSIARGRGGPPRQPIDEAYVPAARGIGGSFAAVALVLASIRLFGVVADVVTQRTQEIGIRVALGASPASVIRLMTTIGTRLVATGIGVGLLVALAVGQVLASVVFGVSPRDPVSLPVVALLLGGISVAASWWPARRAARVDPIIALRAD